MPASNVLTSIGTTPTLPEYLQAYFTFHTRSLNSKLHPISSSYPILGSEAPAELFDRSDRTPIGFHPLLSILSSLMLLSPTRFPIFLAVFFPHDARVKTEHRSYCTSSYMYTKNYWVLSDVLPFDINHEVVAVAALLNSLLIVTKNLLWLILLPGWSL